MMVRCIAIALLVLLAACERTEDRGSQVRGPYVGGSIGVNR